MKVSKAALSLAAFALFACGPAFGLAGFLRRREADTAPPGTGKRRVAIYDDK